MNTNLGDLEDDDVDPAHAADVWLILMLAGIGIGVTGYYMGYTGMVVAGAIMGLSVAGALACVTGHPPSRWLSNVIIGLCLVGCGVIIQLDHWWAILGVSLSLLSLWAAHTVRRQTGPVTCDVSRKVMKTLRQMPGVSVRVDDVDGALPVAVNELTGQAALIGQVHAEASDVASSRAYRDFLRRWERFGAAYAKTGVELRGVLVVADIDDFEPLTVSENGRVVVLTSLAMLRKALVQTIHGTR